jgi:GAF domain-containing protein
LKELASGKNYRVILPCRIGRGQEVELSFLDPTISHQHALIEERDHQVWLSDLDSANGVYVNDQRIQDKAILKTGDVIQLGQIVLQICQTDEEISEKTQILHFLSREQEYDLDHKRLMSIYEITAELSGDQDLTRLGEKIFSRFKGIFQQDLGYIALFQEDGSLQPLFSEPDLRSVPVSRSIINRLFQTGESFLLEDALHEDVFKDQESILALGIRSALCVPLIYHHQIYGLIYLSRHLPGYYKQNDLEFLKSIASILAPLIENARLWSELKGHYDHAMKLLRETEGRLIEMEREVAYGLLAQAMAHEIRNPLMVIGGLVRRITPSDLKGERETPFQAIQISVERIESVLKEVDHFVNLPPPQKKLERVDRLMEEEVERHDLEWQKIGLRSLLSIKTPNVMIPIDAELFRKALSILFREIFLNAPQKLDLNIVLQDWRNDLEILIGTKHEKSRFCELFDPELQKKPWSLSLHLNIAHKIISHHGGKLLFDSSASLALPIMIRMPRTKRSGAPI